MKQPAPKPRPPQNIRAEEAIIGKIIGSSETYWQVSDYLTADQFVLPHHRLIFEAVKECCERGTGPSLSLLESKLPLEFEGQGAVEPVLQILMEKAADVGSALDFVDEVIMAWRERQRIELGKIAGAQGKSFDETRAAIEAKLSEVDDHDRARQAVTVGDSAQIAMDRAADAYEHRGKRAVGILTKIPEIDHILGPIIGGTTVTLAAPSGHGKSALISQILHANAVPSLDLSSIFPALSISLEMSKEQVAYRDIARLTGVPVKRQTSGEFNQKEFTDIQRARQRLGEVKVWVQDRGRMTIKQIANECRIAKRRYGARQFAIDHLKLLEPEHEHWNIVRTVEYASAVTKDLAKELDAVIWQLAQLTKDGQSSSSRSWKFSRGEIYGGGLLFENSDVVIGLAIPTVWLRDNEPEPASQENPKGREQRDQWVRDWEEWKGKAAFSILKNRSGVGSKWKELEFDGPRMRFGTANREDDIPF